MHEYMGTIVNSPILVKALRRHNIDVDNFFSSFDTSEKKYFNLHLYRYQIY